MAFSFAEFESALAIMDGPHGPGEGRRDQWREGHRHQRQRGRRVEDNQNPRRYANE